MTIRLRQVLLAVLAGTAIYIGGWGTISPHGFFRHFPGLGMQWLPVLGPYDEHLVRDVAALYLGLAVLGVGAARRASDDYLVRLAGAVWAVFGLLHLGYHLAHLDMYGTRDAVLNVVGLGGTVVLALALLLPLRRRGG